MRYMIHVKELTTEYIRIGDYTRKTRELSTEESHYFFEDLINMISFHVNFCGEPSGSEQDLGGGRTRTRHRQYNIYSSPDMTEDWEDITTIFGDLVQASLSYKEDENDN